MELLTKVDSVHEYGLLVASAKSVDAAEWSERLFGDN